MQFQYSLDLNRWYDEIIRIGDSSWVLWTSHNVLKGIVDKILNKEVSCKEVF